MTTSFVVLLLEQKKILEPIGKEVEFLWAGKNGKEGRKERFSEGTAKFVV